MICTPWLERNGMGLEILNCMNNILGKLCILPIVYYLLTSFPRITSLP